MISCSVQLSRLRNFNYRRESKVSHRGRGISEGEMAVLLVARLAELHELLDLIGGEAAAKKVLLINAGGHHRVLTFGRGDIADGADIGRDDSINGVEGDPVEETLGAVLVAGDGDVDPALERGCGQRIFARRFVVMDPIAQRIFL